MTLLQRVPLASGVTLHVALAGDPAAPPVMLLHGFPETHRAWRALVPLLGNRFRLVMPDLRGFGGSDRPRRTRDYRIERGADDVFALADALAVARFALVGHDFGGAVAWTAAQRGDPRLERLAVVNGPHPALFARSLASSSAQRAASQYINLFRLPGAASLIRLIGHERFFDACFARLADLSMIPAEERARTIAEWRRPGAMRAMLGWYRALGLTVPPPWPKLAVLDRLVPPLAKVRIPALVVWGMRDKALLPVQLDGIEAAAENVEVVRLVEAGHFAPWQAPDQVARALGPFLERAREA